ncbi:hypothetical protein Tco_0659430 [Tanacetum coccineum]
MKKKGAGTQKDSQICCGEFITKLARKCRVLTEDVVRSLSAPIYYRDLDKTILRDLIDSDGNLIPEDPQSGAPRVGSHTIRTDIMECSSIWLEFIVFLLLEEPDNPDISLTCWQSSMLLLVEKRGEDPRDERDD